MMSALLSVLALVAAQPSGDVSPEQPAEEKPSEKLSVTGDLPSLLGGATLGSGTSFLVVEMGFPLASLAYSQGLSDSQDLGVHVEYNWAASEILLVATWRLGVWQSTRSSFALRTRAGFYSNSGATYVYEGNRPDTGAQANLGLAFSISTGAGLLSFNGDMPATLTFARGKGFILAPTGSVGFEVPLFGDLTVGARASGGYRFATGGAPASGPANERVVVGLSLLIGYRLF